MKTNEELMEDLDSIEAYNRPVGKMVTGASGTLRHMVFRYGYFEDLKGGGVFGFIEKCEVQFINFSLLFKGVPDDYEDRPRLVTSLHEDFCNHLSGKKPMRASDIRLQKLPFWDRLREEWNGLSDDDRFLFLLSI